MVAAEGPAGMSTLIVAEHRERGIKDMQGFDSQYVELSPVIDGQPVETLQ